MRTYEEETYHFGPVSEHNNPSRIGEGVAGNRIYHQLGVCF